MLSYHNRNQIFIYNNSISKRLKRKIKKQIKIKNHPKLILKKMISNKNKMIRINKKQKFEIQINSK